MNLRPSLTAPVVPPQRVAALCAAIAHIEELLETDGPAASAIDAFNADTGHAYTAWDFRTYWRSRNVEDLALEAARPARPRVTDVTRDELIEIVRRIIDGDPHDQPYYVRLLEANVTRPAAAGLIFNPPPDLLDASPDRIVDVALSYRPIAL